MKLIKNILGVAAILLWLTGCTAGSDVGSHETTAGQDIEPQPYKIGIAVYRADDEYIALYQQELSKYLSEEYQAQVKVFDGNNDMAEQEQQLEQMINEGYDAIIMNPVQPTTASRLTDRCQEAGVPIVYINREPPAEEITRWQDDRIAAAYVGSDAMKVGTYQGEIILETKDHGDINLDGTISYVMIQGDENHPDTRYRTEYPVKALADFGLHTKQLYRQSGNWERESGRQLMADALAQYGNEIEVVFCNNDAMANGALEAILAAGRIVGEDIYLVGVDALEETVGHVKAGTITGTVLNDYTGQAHLAADLAVKMIKGEKTDQIQLTDAIKITVSNEIAEALIDPAVSR